MREEIFSIRCEPDEKQAIRSLAEYREQTMSSLIRQLIFEAIENLDSDDEKFNRYFEEASCLASQEA